MIITLSPGLSFKEKKKMVREYEITVGCMVSVLYTAASGIRTYLGKAFSARSTVGARWTGDLGAINQISEINGIF